MNGLECRCPAASEGEHWNECRTVSLPRVLVYVAGPFSPTPEQKARLADDKDETLFRVRDAVEENIAKAGALALVVSKLGAMPMCPHLNTSLPEFEDARPYQFWIEGTEEMLLRCDVAIFTDGWEVSSGARGEMATCKAKNIPAFESLHTLADFLNEDGVEKFLAALRLARVLEWGVGGNMLASIPIVGAAADTIPSPPKLPSVASGPASETPPEFEDFGEIDTTDFEPRSGALKL